MKKLAALRIFILALGMGKLFGELGISEAIQLLEEIETLITKKLNDAKKKG